MNRNFHTPPWILSSLRKHIEQENEQQEEHDDDFTQQTVDQQIALWVRMDSDLVYIAPPPPPPTTTTTTTTTANAAENNGSSSSPSPSPSLDDTSREITISDDLHYITCKIRNSAIESLLSERPELNNVFEKLRGTYLKLLSYHFHKRVVIDQSSSTTTTTAAKNTKKQKKQKKQQKNKNIVVENDNNAEVEYELVVDRLGFVSFEKFAPDKRRLKDANDVIKPLVKSLRSSSKSTETEEEEENGRVHLGNAAMLSDNQHAVAVSNKSPQQQEPQKNQDAAANATVQQPSKVTVAEEDWSNSESILFYPQTKEDENNVRISVKELEALRQLSIDGFDTGDVGFLQSRTEPSQPHESEQAHSSASSVFSENRSSASTAEDNDSSKSQDSCFGLRNVIHEVGDVIIQSIQSTNEDSASSPSRIVSVSSIETPVASNRNERNKEVNMTEMGSHLEPSEIIQSQTDFMEEMVDMQQSMGGETSSQPFDDGIALAQQIPSFPSMSPASPPLISSGEENRSRIDEDENAMQDDEDENENDEDVLMTSDDDGPTNATTMRFRDQLCTQMQSQPSNIDENEYLRMLIDSETLETGTVQTISSDQNTCPALSPDGRPSNVHSSSPHNNQQHDEPSSNSSSKQLLPRCSIDLEAWNNIILMWKTR